MPERIFSEGLVLPDGRKVRVLSYDDGSIRFRVDDAPYVLEEAFLAGGRNDHAIIKIAPKGSTPAEADADSGNDPLDALRERVVALRRQAAEVEDDKGAGRVLRKHKREGLDAALVMVLSWIDAIHADGTEWEHLE